MFCVHRGGSLPSGTTLSHSYTRTVCHDGHIMFISIHAASIDWVPTGRANTGLIQSMGCLRTSLGQLHQVLNPPSFGRQYDFRVRLLIFSFMAPLVSSYRYGGDEVDLHLAKADSKILHEKIPDKAYSDDEVMSILVTKSKAQLNDTLNHYKDEYSEDILKKLEDVDERGTEEDYVTRVIATRDEVDLKIIVDEYQKRDSSPLDYATSKDMRGDYGSMLLALL
ncbi:putative pumilio -like protein 7, chloroplastic-like [Capsicum annuum]|nr:putative pumilio -like protein 7, chloroplastic-like [Capsicum annuum]KAF3673637.1 putative pumilio -like protein 7, chloroplastic-like [Capsicum annuum]